MAYDTPQGVVVSDLRTIFWHVLRSQRFVLDIVSFFPFVLIFTSPLVRLQTTCWYAPVGVGEPLHDVCN